MGFLLIQSDPSYQPTPEQLDAATTKTRGVVNGPGFRFLGAVAPRCECKELARFVEFPADGAYLAVDQRNKADRAGWMVTDGKARRLTAEEADRAGFTGIPADRLGAKKG